MAPANDRKQQLQTCYHLQGLCKAPKIPDSHFCSAHACPRCMFNKSSRATLCLHCATTGAKHHPGVSRDETAQLDALLKRGAITTTEYNKRLNEMREKAERVHRRAPLPKSTAEIGGPCKEIALASGYETVYKLTYDYKGHVWNRTLSVVSIEEEAFDEGAMRMAYRMTDWTCRPSESKMVAKVSKDPDEAVRTYFIDVQMQAMCQFFSGEFNVRGVPKKVHFVDAFIIDRFSLPSEHPARIMACEPYLEGEYTKHNNNYGWQSPDDRNTPQAFSHFTWWDSAGQYIVVDIQGVGDSYTDPQIHSKDGRGFGKGNVGEEGIEKFFGTHKCNSVCKLLGLTDKIEDFKGTAQKEYVPEKLTYDSPPTEEDLAFFNLNREQYDKLVSEFRAADSDGSGELSLSELPGLCSRLGIEIPTSQLMNILVNIDRDGSGEISLLEFLFWWTGYEP